jgi:Flp pilus assembly protein TadB
MNNRIEQLMVRQDWESRHEVPILRIASLCLLAIVLACMVVVLFHLQTPGLSFLIVGTISIAGYPVFVLGRRHARRLDPPSGRR